MPISSAQVRGASRSKAVWLGFIIMLMGYLQANLTSFAPWLDQKWIGLANVLLGMFVMVVRFYTDRSLEEKGYE